MLHVRGGRQGRLHNWEGRAIPDDADQYLSIDDLSSAISSFSQTDMLRLEKAARYYGRWSNLEWSDLFQEAVVRCLQGSRKCPSTVNPMIFLANAMRSIVSAEYEAASARPAMLSLSATGTDGKALEIRTPELNAEELLLEDDQFDSRLASVEALFCKDEDAHMLILALIEGLNGQAIRDALSWDERKLATVRKRVRRTVDAAVRRGDFA